MTQNRHPVTELEHKVSELQVALYGYVKSVHGTKRAADVIDAVVKVTNLKLRMKLIQDFTKDLKLTLTGAAKPVNMMETVQYIRQPVDPKTFLLDPYYLDKSEEVYPELIPYYEEMNSGKYFELVLTGGIGVAKTTLALWSQAYQLYLLSCMRNPQKTFGQDRSSELIIIFQSITEKLAKELDYARFKALIGDVPYFKEHFPYRTDIESKLVFPNRIEVKPVAGTDTAAIGQNIIGGIIDEINYMAVVENSKQADGNMYDQAVAIYNSIARRRESRFSVKGKMPGLICLVSSRKYPGQFTDQKEIEAKTNPRIYIYDKRLWEIKPDKYGVERFWIFTGDESRKAFIVENKNFDIKKVKDEDQRLYMQVPVEHKAAFEKDMVNSLREIAGVATLTSHPFFHDTDKVASMFKKVHKPIFNLPETDFVTSKLNIITSNIVRPDEPRWVHIDLSISKDRTGVAIGYVDKFVQVDRGSGLYDILPKIVFDGMLAIKAPKGGEILYYKIRNILNILRQQGMNIAYVTFDTFQSTDSIQLLRQQGFKTGQLSMDTSLLPYMTMKQACYDDRIVCPEHPIARLEIAALEYLTKKDKVDHPPTGSKDVADAMAGVVAGLTTRREIWIRHGINPNRVPKSLETIMANSDKKMKDSNVGDAA